MSKITRWFFILFLSSMSAFGADYCENLAAPDGARAKILALQGSLQGSFASLFDASRPNSNVIQISKALTTVLKVLDLKTPESRYFFLAELLPENHFALKDIDYGRESDSLDSFSSATISYLLNKVESATKKNVLQLLLEGLDGWTRAASLGSSNSPKVLFIGKLRAEHVSIVGELLTRINPTQNTLESATHTDVRKLFIAAFPVSPTGRIEALKKILNPNQHFVLSSIDSEGSPSSFADALTSSFVQKTIKGIDLTSGKVVFKTMLWWLVEGISKVQEKS